MQLNLLISLSLLAILATTSCSTSPPELPVDYSSVRKGQVVEKSMFSNTDLIKTCDEIEAEKESLNQALVDIDKNIEAGRAGDQALVYLFGAALMAFDTNGNVKERREIIQSRLDELRLLQRHKRCHADFASG